MGPTEWRLLFLIGVAPSLLVLLVRPYGLFGTRVVERV